MGCCGSKDASGEKKKKTLKNQGPVAADICVKDNDDVKFLRQVKKAIYGPDGADGADVTEKVQARKMHDGHLKVLDALKAGICKPTPIADAIGLSTRRVHDLLDELMDEFGKVERVLNADGKPRLGEYQLVEQVAG